MTNASFGRWRGLPQIANPPRLIAVIALDQHGSFEPLIQRATPNRMAGRAHTHMEERDDRHHR
jgi:hypothetical protein